MRENKQNSSVSWRHADSAPPSNFMVGRVLSQLEIIPGCGILLFLFLPQEKKNMSEGDFLPLILLRITTLVLRTTTLLQELLLYDYYRLRGASGIHSERGKKGGKRYKVKKRCIHG